MKHILFLFKTTNRKCLSSKIAVIFRFYLRLVHNGWNNWRGNDIIIFLHGHCVLVLKHGGGRYLFMGSGMMITLMKYMRTNSQRTVVIPRRARPFPTLRTVFFKENFLARPSTFMMNFKP